MWATNMTRDLRDVWPNKKNLIGMLPLELVINKVLDRHCTIIGLLTDILDRSPASFTLQLEAFECMFRKMSPHARIDKLIILKTV
jgi:hypothetical protein